MAPKTHTESNPEAATQTVAIPANWFLTVEGHTFTTSDLTTANIGYILSKGIKRSMDESAAFGLKSKMKPVGSDEAKLGEAFTVEEKKAYQAAAMAERASDLLAGTVGTRTPGLPKVSGLDKYIRDEALADIKKTLKVKGGKMPTKLGPDGTRVTDQDRLNKIIALVISAKPGITARATMLYEAAQAAAGMQTEEADVDLSEFADEEEEAAE